MSRNNLPLEDQPVSYCPRCRDNLKMLRGEQLGHWFWCEGCHIVWEVSHYPDVRTWGGVAETDEGPGSTGA